MCKVISSLLLKASLFSVICVTLFSCSNELHMTLPEGPAGQSAYEVWVDEVLNGNIDWPQDRTDINNFFLYLKGEDGVDGKSAYELWLEEVEKGLQNPHNPDHNWPKDETDLSDFWYYLTGADGKDGVTPNIGDNGNWWVNGEDTGIPATGADGQDGSMPDITIGDNGHWYINGEDTGVSAKGNDGTSGKSAYQLWVEAVTSDEGLEDPHNPGNKWPATEIDIDDFWRYLRGEDGKDGEIIIQQPEPTEGVYNVIAQYSVDELEYVNWADGKVRYLVYDKNLNPLPNATVSNMPHLPNKTYTTDENGIFYVSNVDLPINTVNINNPFGSAIVNGEETSNKTFVPCQIAIRLRLKDAPRFETLDAVWAFDIPGIEVPFVVERKVDANSDWETIPAHVGDTYCNVHIYDTNENEITLSYVDKYDLSRSDGFVLTYRKIINSKDGTFNAEKLAAYAKLNGITNYSDRPIEWWGEYNENSKRFYTIGFGSGNDGCYGERIILSNNEGNKIAIEDVPLQPMPLLDEILVYNLDIEKNILYPAMKICSDNTYTSLSNKIYEELLLEENFELGSQEINGFKEYCPRRIDENSFYAENIYCVQYSYNGQNTMTPSQPLHPHLAGDEYDGYFTFLPNANAVEGSIIQLRPTNAGRYNFFAYSFAEIFINDSSNSAVLRNLEENTNDEILTKLPTLTTFIMR